MRMTRIFSLTCKTNNVAVVVRPVDIAIVDERMLVVSELLEEQQLHYDEQ
jgi:hypothetical protein